MNYDVEAMRFVAKEAIQLIVQLRQEISMLQEICPDKEWFQEETVHQLFVSCSGYERLILKLEAAANLYSSAVQAAGEMVDF